MPSEDGQILPDVRASPDDRSRLSQDRAEPGGVAEYSEGLRASRVGGRKFAWRASQAVGYGNLMLMLEQQAAFVEGAPEIFRPVPGGWGKMGYTHFSPGGGRGCPKGCTPSGLDTAS
jgi:hypothetical protein